MGGSRTWRVVVFVSSLAVSVGAGEPEVTESLGASLNLPGLQNQVEVVWTRGSLKHAVAHAVTPSFSRLGAWAQWTPTAAVELRAGVDPAIHHGGGSLLGFATREAAFDEATRHGRSDARAEISGRLYLAPTLRARAGSFVATAGGELERWYATGMDAYYYEPTRDTLLRRTGDTVVRAAGTLLHERRGAGGRLLRVGGNYRLSAPREAWSARVVRAGVVAQWTLGDRALGLREPTLAINVFRYLEDPYKKDETGASVGLRCRLR